MRPASAVTSPQTSAPATTAIPPVTSTSAPPTTLSTTVSSTAPPTPVVDLGLIPPPRPGVPQVIFQASAPTRRIAITIDDGYCAPCVNAYVAFAKASGIHITFSPNGTYRALWTPHAPVLRSLIEAGQVQIGNHTYSHPDITRLLHRGRVQEEIDATRSGSSRPSGSPADHGSGLPSVIIRPALITSPESSGSRAS